MISDCPGCGKPIFLEDPQQVHCMNCGQSLFDPITEEMMKEKGFR
jgi:ribosomal protein S27E